MNKRLSALLAILALAAAPAQARDLSVTVTNLTHGIYFTPLLIAAHSSDVEVFTPGRAASPALTAMAECGDISSLVAELEAADADIAANPAMGVLAPGAEASAVVAAADSNDHLSLVAMMLPTNDGFIGLAARPVPEEPGDYSFELYGYDAGTEANDELLDTSGCTPGMPGIPADPGGHGGTGGSGVAVDELNDTVHVHRGNLGDSLPTGGVSDLDSTVHRWLNPVARVRLTVQ